MFLRPLIPDEAEKPLPSTVSGTVRLLNARIGQLDCSGAELNNRGEIALYADGVEVRGAVFLRAHPIPGASALPCRVTGQVRLPGARIGGGRGFPSIPARRSAG